MLAPQHSNPIRVAISQMACGNDPQANLFNQLRLAEDAAERGAQIFCTQELFRTQYFCQVEDYRFFQQAESIPGPSTQAFAAIAKKREMVIVASLFERRTAGLYHNTAVIIDADGTLLGSYRKMHIPDDPLYYENFYASSAEFVGQFRLGQMAKLVI